MLRMYAIRPSLNTVATLQWVSSKRKLVQVVLTIAKCCIRSTHALMMVNRKHSCCSVDQDTEENEYATDDATDDEVVLTVVVNAADRYGTGPGPVVSMSPVAELVPVPVPTKELRETADIDMGETAEAKEPTRMAWMNSDI
jgi:hypothetical protein